MRNKILLGIIILIVLALVFFKGSQYIRETREEALMKQIKVGMNVEEVVKILGNPDAIYEADNNGETEFFHTYFTQNTAKSSEPAVIFDSLGKVDRVWYYGW